VIASSAAVAIFWIFSLRIAATLPSTSGD